MLQPKKICKDTSAS